MALETGYPVPASEPEPAVAPALTSAPSTGRVRPRVEQTADGVLDPTYWQGLDAQTQGAVAEALPDMAENDAEYQEQIEDTGTTGPGAPSISSVIVNDTNVTWLTDTPSTSQAQWTGPESGGSSVNSDLVTEHSVPFTATASGTYTITVLSRDADGNASGDSIEYVVP